MAGNGPRFGWYLLAASAVVLSACQQDGRPAVSVDQARQIQAEFQKQGGFTPPPRTISDVAAVLNQYRPDPARLADLQARATAAPPSNATPARLYEFFYLRGVANGRLGRLKEQIADQQEAVRIAEVNKLDGSRAYQQLQAAEGLVGNNRKALRYAEQRLAASISSGRHGAIAHSYSQMAHFQAALGDLEAARKSISAAQRALANSGYTRWPGYNVSQSDQRSAIQRALTEIEMVSGRYEEAERQARDALANVHLSIQNEAQIRQFIPDIAPGAYDGLELTSIARLGHTLLRQGRAVESEIEYRKALVKALQLNGRDDIVTAALALQLANALFQQNRADEAGHLAQVALDTYERLGIFAGSRMVANALSIRAGTLDAKGDFDGAARMWDRAKAVFADDPAEAFRHVEGNPNFLASRIGANRGSEILPQARKLAEVRRQRLGERHYDVAEARGLLGTALAQSGQIEAALAEYRAAIPILLQVSRRNEDEGGLVDRDKRLQLILEGYIDLLSGLKSAPADLNPAAEAFRVADAARARGVQRALAASAARASVGDPDLASLVRQEQDAQKQIAAQFGLLSNILSGPADQQDSAATRKLRENIDKLRDARAALREEIERRFPEYVSLIDPRPSTVAQVQQVLQPKEALLATYVGLRKTYIWAIPKSGQVAFAATASGEKQIARQVAALRKALEPDASTLGDIPAYNLQLAHQLYTQLIEPVRDGLRNADSYLVVPDKALGQLPFGLLVTKPSNLPSDNIGLFSGYRRVPFVVREAAVTQLPSVAALGTLRRLPAAAADRKPFVGFGDPWFSPEQAQQAQVASASGQIATRGLQTRNRPLTRRSAPSTQKVDSAELAQLPRLPDTADEVRSIAVALKADAAADIFLGSAANERRVKSMQLADRKVVMFATHGLVPGDLNGLYQPALALSSPRLGEGSDDGDGLLTMEEILGLRLNADWVVLSACNTATGEGAGAEAVSGLGRAFFYAGTRTLLVSNWPVETTSARALTTDLFRRQAEDSRLGKARAMQQAMLALLDGPGYVEDGKTVFSYAHPIFWAPFSVVGDGAAASPAMD